MVMVVEHKTATAEQVKEATDRARSWLKTTNRFSSTGNIARLAVMEFLLNEQGLTAYL